MGSRAGMAIEKEGIKLTKRPKGVIVIEGFPGFGLVSTITTGFLIDHLKCEKIGSYFFEDPPAMVAIHGCKVVDPIGIFYNKQYNIVIIHAISSAAGLEWRAADLVIDLCKQLDAKELITIEGVGSQEIGKEPKSFYFTHDSKKAKTIEKLGYKCIGEGIIIGVTSALLLKSDVPVTSFFAETASKMPDSKAAAKIIETIDKYLGLKVDYTPLLKQAQEFEGKLKGILQQHAKAEELKQEKKFAYIG